MTCFIYSYTVLYPCNLFLGVGFIKKTAAKQLTPTIVINVDGETISVSISAGPKSHKASYKLGEEYSVEGESGTGKVSTRQ